MKKIFVLWCLTLSGYAVAAPQLADLEKCTMVLGQAGMYIAMMAYGYGEIYTDSGKPYPERDLSAYKDALCKNGCASYCKEKSTIPKNVDAICDQQNVEDKHKLGCCAIKGGETCRRVSKTMRRLRDFSIDNAQALLVIGCQSGHGPSCKDLADMKKEELLTSRKSCESGKIPATCARAAFLEMTNHNEIEARRLLEKGCATPAGEINCDALAKLPGGIPFELHSKLCETNADARFCVDLGRKLVSENKIEDAKKWLKIGCNKTTRGPAYSSNVSNFNPQSAQACLSLAELATKAGNDKEAREYQTLACAKNQSMYSCASGYRNPPKAEQKAPEIGSTPKEWMQNLGSFDPKAIGLAKEKLLSSNPDPQLVPDLMAMLTHKQKDTRLAALWVVYSGKYCPYLDSQNFDAVYTALKDAVVLPDRDYRINLRLAKSVTAYLLRDQKTIDKLMNDLNSRDPGTRLAAAQTLGTARYFPASPKLIEMYGKGGYIQNREIQFALYDLSYAHYKSTEISKWKNWWKQKQADLAQNKPKVLTVTESVPTTIEAIRAKLKPGVSFLSFTVPKDEIPEIIDGHLCRKGFSDYDVVSVRYWDVEKKGNTIYVKVEGAEEATMCNKPQPLPSSERQDYAALERFSKIKLIPLFNNENKPYLWLDKTVCAH